MTLDEQAGLPELAKRIIEIRDRKREMKQEEEDLNAELDMISKKALPLLDEMDAQKVTLKGIGTIYVKTNFYATVVKDKYDEFVNWLDTNELGHLAKRQVNAQTLKSEYKRWMEEDKPLPPDELLKVYKEPDVAVRRETPTSQED